jgi:hypothetical protein
MEHDPNTARRNRETILTLAMTALLAGGILFFLVLVSGGFFVFVVAAVLAIALVGLLHYLLWGYNLSQEVASEQEQAETRAQADAQEDQERFWDRPRRY